MFHQALSRIKFRGSRFWVQRSGSKVKEPCNIELQQLEATKKFNPEPLNLEPANLFIDLYQINDIDFILYL